MAATTLRRPLRQQRHRHAISSTARQIKRHVPYEHPDVPGVCHTCHLPILLTYDGRYTNDRHVTLDELLSQIVTSGYDVMALAAGEHYG
jgi:hypothetical protein